jgi:hypothetical protein
VTLLSPQVRAGQVYGSAAKNAGHFAGRGYADGTSLAVSVYSENAPARAADAPLDTAMLRQAAKNYVLDKSETGLYVSMYSPVAGEYSLDHGTADNAAGRIRWQLIDQSETTIAAAWQHRESINAILGMSGYGGEGSKNVALRATFDDGVITLRDAYRDREPITLRIAPERPRAGLLHAVA